MNKNWLYRVLALALIAMMALPFAMAEDVQTNAVEEAVQSEDFVLGGDDEADVAKTEKAEANVIADFWTDGDTLYNEDGDEVDEVDKGFFYKGQMVVSVIFPHEYIKSTKFSISPSSAAKVKKLNDYECMVTMKKKCDEVSLKIKYKYRDDVDEKWTGYNSLDTVKFEIKDAWDIDKIKANQSDDEFDPENPDGVLASTEKPDMGIGDPIAPFAANSDGESLDYMNEDAEEVYDPDESGWGYYKFSWSNKKVGAFITEDGEIYAKNPEGMPMTSEEIAETFRPVFFKKGTTKLTFINQFDKKKKVTIKFEVKAAKELSKRDKPSVPDNGVTFKVKSAKYKSIDEAEVEVYVANGTGKDLKAHSFTVNILDRKGQEIFTEGKLAVKKIKKGKIQTVKMTFKAKNGQIVYGEDGYGDLQDIDNYLSLDEEAIADEVVEWVGDLEVKSNIQK